MSTFELTIRSSGDLFVEIYHTLCREKAEQQVQEWFSRGGAPKPRQKKPVAPKPAAKQHAKRGRRPKVVSKVPDSEGDENVASEG